MLSTLLALSTLLTYLRFIHPLFWWHLYTVHSFSTHKNLWLTCLFILCTYSLEQSFWSYSKLIICSFSQLHPKNLSVSAWQPNNWCVCVCVCVWYLYKCIFVAINELCKVLRLRAPERRGTVEILILLLILSSHENTAVFAPGLGLVTATHSIIQVHIYHWAKKWFECEKLWCDMKTHTSTPWHTHNPWHTHKHMHYGCT